MTTETKAPITKFNLAARLLHWSMAVMVIAQFFIGVTMIAALSYYPLLLAIHRPLGIAILVFAIVRLVNRITRRATILVEHPKGQSYSDGKRYLKFYIPLPLLRRVEA